VTLGKGGRGYLGPQEPELVREYSEDTQKYIDDEIARMMNERYTHVLSLLEKHRNLLEYIAKRLLEKESMDGKEFEEIIKAESHCAELEAEAGRKADDARYIQASAIAFPEEPEVPDVPAAEAADPPDEADSPQEPEEPAEKPKPRRRRTAVRKSTADDESTEDEKPKRRGRKPKKTED
jgi:hypothetical protein